ncbi:MAG: thiamine pyrophosphate-binding protein [Rhodospirillales bacterium]|nr:thiamine pyrophosphate-binding protein [Rhodospirillales bacterium]
MNAPGRERTGGRILIDALLGQGVKRVYCVPGESYLEALDALHGNAIQVVACRHESGATFMAEAEAKLTGRPGVAFATRGPGAANAAIGVHTARQDSTPLVLLLGDVGRDFIGREAFQEVDLAAFFAPLCKWSARVEEASRLPEYLARAFHVAASGRPGPVVLALPEDLLRESALALDVSPLAANHPAPSVVGLVELRKLLAASKRPLAIAGGGGWTQEGRAALRAFAEINDLPVAVTFRRQDLFAGDHPGFAGDLGLGPDPALIATAKEADLLLLIGTRMGEIASQGYSLFAMPVPEKTVIHIHPEAEELGRVFRPTLAIQADGDSCAKALAGLPGANGPWADWRAKANRARLAWATPQPTGGALDLGLAMGVVERLLPADAIVTTDAGNFAGWPQRFLTFGGRRLLGPTCGAMGYGVPAAVAASLAQPERSVLACVGDGGILMTGNELATALQQGAKPVILVFDNGMYGTIRMHQEGRHPGRVVGTQLANPDFALWARSFGAHAETVTRTEEFEPALARALAAGKAALLHLKTDPNIITPRATIADLRAKAAGQ